MLGDIFGRAGRDAIIKQIPEIRKILCLDFVVANAENATQGRGIILKQARALLRAGVDCLTLGDHAFDQRELVNGINSEPRLLRPINFAQSAPGNGFGVFTDAKGRKVLVISALGRVFMQPTFSDPFFAVGNVLKKYPLGTAVAASILDFHAEATSEKCAMGDYCDGLVSLVAGSHTHIPTSDHRTLGKGTAFISDLGMCGNYDSIIGMHKDEPVNRFVTGMRKDKFIPATGEATICGVIVETDDKLGLAKSIKPFRSGGILSQSHG